VCAKDNGWKWLQLQQSLIATVAQAIHAGDFSAPANVLGRLEALSLDTGRVNPRFLLRSSQYLDDVTQVARGAGETLSSSWLWWANAFLDDVSAKSFLGGFHSWLASVVWISSSLPL